MFSDEDLKQLKYSANKEGMTTIGMDECNALLARLEAAEDIVERAEREWSKYWHDDDPASAWHKEKPYDWKLRPDNSCTPCGHFDSFAAWRKSAGKES